MKRNSDKELFEAHELYETLSISDNVSANTFLWKKVLMHTHTFSIHTEIDHGL